MRRLTPNFATCVVLRLSLSKKIISEQAMNNYTIMTMMMTKMRRFYVQERKVNGK